MTSEDFFQSEAFKAMLDAIQQQYGPIEYFTVCNHTDLPLEDEPIDEEVLEVEYPDTLLIPERAASLDMRTAIKDAFRVTPGMLGELRDSNARSD